MARFGTGSPGILGAMAPDRAGKWSFLTGNQIAALLTHFKLARLQQQGRLPSSPIVVRTEVLLASSAVDGGWQLLVPGTPDDLGKFVASELPKWAEVVKRSGAKVE